ncbi:MAG TPA: cellulase family glycosylhydrolase [Mycobacteriales bacterium]|nr:cellulase family glycosylhydrolase [Mycobacteriales bacterium]
MTAPASAATGAAPALALPLSVQGNRIVDALGQTVVLSGVQRDGTEGGTGATSAPVTTDELGWLGFQQPGSWHARLVRVPLGSAQWTGACPNLATNPSAYRARIDAEVAALTAQRIVTLLDLHTSTAGCTSIARHAMPDAPISQQFWADVATRYKANQMVAFELYNEPHFVPDLTWLSGSSDASVQDCDVTQRLSANLATRTQQKTALAKCQMSLPRYKAAGMQSLYDVVVKAAPGHLVVADGPSWGSTPSAKTVNAWAGNLVLGLHPYTCTSPGAACNTTAKALANLQLLDGWLAPAAQSPVLVTEMGWPTYSDSGGASYIDGAGYFRDTLNYLKRQSPPWGFVAFAFDGGSRGSFSLIEDTATYAPNSTGRPVFDALRAS